MTTIRKKLTGLKTPRNVRETETAFQHREVDCSDIPELGKDEFKQSVRLGPGEALAKTAEARFHVYKDKSGQFRWRLTGVDGGILAISATGYPSRAACVRAIAQARSAMAAA